jgi:NitT/TauT family transport system substrate-binding protein
VINEEENPMSMHSATRRRFLTRVGTAAAALAMGASPLHAQTRTKLRVGYLRVLSVDAHLWIADHLGTLTKEGLEIEAREFVTGIELFQALIGGSLDVLTTGGVLSSFPARGQGKVFLVNDLEWAVGQIWVYPEQGIKSLKDLKGMKVATTRGTTAHDLLHQALKSVGLDSNRDVEIINQRMSEAVTSFIAGAVPVVACWVPFNVSIKAKAPKAKLLTDAGPFPSATIVDGWAARNDFYEKNKDVLKRFIRAWIPANDFLVAKPRESLKFLHQNRYSNLAWEDVEEMHRVIKLYRSAEWVGLYRDGSVAKWLNQVTNFNVEVGAIQNPIMAETYFDPSLYLEVAASMGIK